MTRRSTETTTVFCILSLTTTPWRMRLGMTFPSSLASGARLLAEQGLDARQRAAHVAHARGVLQLAAGLAEAQVERLLLQVQQLRIELVRRHATQVLGLLRGHGG